MYDSNDRRIHINLTSDVNRCITGTVSGVIVAAYQGTIRVPPGKEVQYQYYMILYEAIETLIFYFNYFY